MSTPENMQEPILTCRARVLAGLESRIGAVVVRGGGSLNDRVIRDMIEATAVGIREAEGYRQDYREPLDGSAFHGVNPAALDEIS